jgi:FkbM family methyltransferase
MRACVSEVGLAYRVGADWRTTTLLVVNFILFHLGNCRPLQRLAARLKWQATYDLRLSGRKHVVTMRTFAGDLFVFNEVFGTRCYEVPTEFSGGIRTVLDAGANVGLTTLFLSQVFPDARFVCVEPSRGNVELLSRNLRAVDCATVIWAAAGDRDGKLYFREARWAWGGHTSAQAGTYPVCARSIPSILDELGIETLDLLKVDIENGVERLFHRNNQWLSRVRMIVVELFAGYGISQFENDVAPFGFTVLPENSDHGNRMVMAVKAAAVT